GGEAEAPRRRAACRACANDAQVACAEARDRRAALRRYRADVRRAPCALRASRSRQELESARRNGTLLQGNGIVRQAAREALRPARPSFRAAARRVARAHARRAT